MPTINVNAFGTTNQVEADDAYEFASALRKAFKAQFDSLVKMHTPRCYDTGEVLDDETSEEIAAIFLAKGISEAMEKLDDLFDVQDRIEASIASLMKEKGLTSLRESLIAALKDTRLEAIQVMDDLEEILGDELADNDPSTPDDILRHGKVLLTYVPGRAQAGSLDGVYMDWRNCVDRPSEAFASFLRFINYSTEEFFAAVRSLEDKGTASRVEADPSRKKLLTVDELREILAESIGYLLPFIGIRVPLDKLLDLDMDGPVTISPAGHDGSGGGGEIGLFSFETGGGWSVPLQETFTTGDGERENWILTQRFGRDRTTDWGQDMRALLADIAQGEGHKPEDQPPAPRR
jgi:hypothetical protein